jgi:hypothetical protein
VVSKASFKRGIWQFESRHVLLAELGGVDLFDGKGLLFQPAAVTNELAPRLLVHV